MLFRKRERLDSCARDDRVGRPMKVRGCPIGLRLAYGNVENQHRRRPLPPVVAAVAWQRGGGVTTCGAERTRCAAGPSLATQSGAAYRTSSISHPSALTQGP
jgi:hypothetical protein